ncbi:MAG: hypothetical protein RLZZ15_3932, partial [Verrucomicrobiota bacterium]
SAWTATEFTTPRPVAVIRWCDAKSDALVAARRQRARAETAPAGAAPATYSRGEQISHYLTHGAGLAASITGLVLLIVFAATRGDARQVWSAVAFGVTLVALYAALLNFRRLRATHWGQAFHKYNHAAAFLLIAGTTTPFFLNSLRGPWGWSLFGIVWALCLGGAIVRLIGRPELHNYSHAAYLLLALVGLVAVKPLVATVPQGALWLLLAGALCYGAGTVFHVWQRLRYHQAMRHAFAIGGSACHLVAVLVFVLPRA